MEEMPADPSTSDKPGAKTVIEIRKGQAPAQLLREEFAARFRAAFIDPAFAAEAESVGRLESIAWGAYSEGRKAPFTQKAGPGYADPDYDPKDTVSHEEVWAELLAADYGLEPARIDVYPQLAAPRTQLVEPLAAHQR